MADETRHNPYDDLAEQLDFCMRLGPGSPNVVISTFAKVLEQHGIRVVLAAVSDDWTHPQVELTATFNDVTAEVVGQVVEPVLVKAGVPPNMVPMLKVAAGVGAVKMLHKYTQPRQEQPFQPRQPRWDPSRPRRK